ncbi:hypothetical protein [Jiangella muralis]|uniref:hypothetical protein n=1 Tax=Jiangella muralis TaxID=702383 RepID=UPI00069E0C9D|nr:hypothetical protein [Jiangella muralis]
MNGELAAITAMAAHGSRWLATPGTQPPPELLEANSCFRYVRLLNVDVGRPGILGPGRTAHGTADWLVALRRGGADRLVLVSRPPMPGAPPLQVTSAFANGGSWGLLATGDAAALWTIAWTVGDRNAPDSRVWDLAATSGPAHGWQPAVPAADAARSTLLAALDEIGRFAEDAGLGEWSEWFTRAQALLDDEEPVAPYHGDILPEQSPLQLRQLAAAAVQAWVFGGMGSWNDVWLEDQVARTSHERLSRALYDAILTALTAAAGHQSPSRDDGLN